MLPTDDRRQHRKTEAGQEWTHHYMHCASAGVRPAGASGASWAWPPLTLRSKCALQGNPDPELGSRIKAVESILVAMAQRPGHRGMPMTNVPDNTCRLWNRGNCTFPRCRFRHTCSTCGGDHPMVHCQRFAGGRTPAPGGRSLPNKKY